MGFFPRTHAVFGAMRDKDIDGMLQRLLPLVSDWYVCDLPVPRAATAAQLSQTLRRVAAPTAADAVTSHASPSRALAAALAAADPADRIVVFGSFLCVGDVLKEGVPRSSPIAPTLVPTPAPT
jgi:dihydrofolate synthase/folylpolyglutamate synthase